MNYSSKNRDLILEKLRGVDTHPTAEEVYFMVRSEMPCIGIATVYRNLDQLCESGSILRLEGDVKRYDGNTCDHLHVRCPRCDRVFDVDAGKLMESYNEFRNESNSMGLGIKVEFVKVCNQCNETKENEQ